MKKDTKIQSYPWYTSDWILSETRLGMNLAERGLYRDLIDFAYEHGSIPSCRVQLMRISCTTRREFERAWPKVREQFEERDGRLYNEKVTNIRNKLQAYRDAMVNAGRKAAAQRWHNQDITELCDGSTQHQPQPQSNSNIRRRPKSVEHAKATGAAADAALTTTTISNGTEPDALRAEVETDIAAIAKMAGISGECSASIVGGIVAKLRKAGVAASTAERFFQRKVDGIKAGTIPAPRGHPWFAAVVDQGLQHGEFSEVGNAGEN